ncbi:HNH endonuclease [Archangium gephyra]|uniref:HNH endonuclease n=1 Tax=Archangium gephyra TaxID=48 RepID=UPI0035D51837
MRKGKRPRGLVGSGWSTDLLVSREHWGEKGKSVLYVPLTFDALVPPYSDKDLLPVEVLQAALPNDVVNWDTPGGGIEIRDEALTVLERLWDEHLLRIGYWPQTESPSQERPLRLVRRKARDSAFSRRVRAASGGRCAVCPSVMVYESVGILETAHIRAVEADGPDAFPNALALCPNHHALFDEGFWTVEQGRLVFSAALPEALRGTFAETLHSRWPLSPEHLEWHRRERFRP